MCCQEEDNSRRLDDTIVSQHVLGHYEDILGEQGPNSAPLGRGTMETCWESRDQIRPHLAEDQNCNTNVWVPSFPDTLVKGLVEEAIARQVGCPYSKSRCQVLCRMMKWHTAAATARETDFDPKGQAHKQNGSQVRSRHRTCTRLSHGVRPS